MIVRALYGLKSSGTALRSHLARCMESLGYESCKADPDLLLKWEIRPDDGVQYCSYLLCYVDDILYIHHNTDAILEWLHKLFPLKKGYWEQDLYLGVKLHKTRFASVWAWEMSSAKYVQEAVGNCAAHLAANYGCRYRLSMKVGSPFKMVYDPELNTSPELDPDAASHYLTIICIIRWMIKLGRIDIITKVSLLSSHIVLPVSGT